MSYILLAFAHDKSDFISRVMAWATFANYTHVALIRGDCVIEASGIGHPQGVRLVCLWDWSDKHFDAVYREMPHPDPERVWEIAQAEIGKSYDWGWLRSWIMRRDWRKNDKWTCSELIAWAAEQAGHPLIAGDHLNRVTPQMLFDLTQE